MGNDKMWQINQIVAIVLHILLGVLINRTACAKSVITSPIIRIQINNIDAITAKNIAIDKAKKNAFAKIVQLHHKITDYDTVRFPNASEMEKIISSFTIESEKFSHKKYIGEFAIHFDQDKLNDYISKSAQNSTIKQQHRYPSLDQSLILPIYITPDEAMLWTYTNPWKEYLVNHKYANHLMLPLYDLQDIQTVAISDINLHDRVKILQMMKRYNKTSLVVPNLKRLSHDNDYHELTITIFSKNGSIKCSQEATLIPPNDHLATALSLTINFFKKYECDLLLQKQPKRYTVIINFDDQSSWDKTKKHMKKHGFSFILKSLSSQQAKIMLQSNLSFAKIQKILSAHNYVIHADHNKVLYIRHAQMENKN